MALPPPCCAHAQPQAAPARRLQLQPPQHPSFSMTLLTLCQQWASAHIGCSAEMLLFAAETASEEGVSFSSYMEQFTWCSHTCLLGQAQNTEVMGGVCGLSTHLRINEWMQPKFWLLLHLGSFTGVNYIVEMEDPCKQDSDQSLIFSSASGPLYSCASVEVKNETKRGKPK